MSADGSSPQMYEATLRAKGRSLSTAGLDPVEVLTWVIVGVWHHKHPQDICLKVGHRIGDRKALFPDASIGIIKR